MQSYSVAGQLLNQYLAILDHKIEDRFREHDKRLDDHERKIDFFVRTSLPPVEGETVWLTQSQMADLFGRDRTVITKHIRNIFAEQELVEGSNVQILHYAN